MEDICVRRVELREIRLRLKEPFQISSGAVYERRILLVQVESGGAVGWGECVAGEQPNYSSETIDTAWLALTQWLGPRLLNAHLAHPEEVFPLLDVNLRGHLMAKASLEMAVWDLEAERQSRPLAQLLGGIKRRIPVGISIGIQDSPAELAAKAGEAVRTGYRKIKVKIEPGRDLDYLQAVCRELGGGELVMADANSAYTLSDLPLFREIDKLGLMMIEQPLAWDDLRRHALLQTQLRTPLCLDESITSLDRAEDMVDLASGRIVNIKPGRVGGFRNSRAIHDFCADRKIPVWCGGMLESGIGRAHNVALASLPNFSLPGDISPSSRYWERDIVKPEWTMSSDGTVTVPLDRPGIGVAPDLDRIKNLTVRRTTLD